MSAHPSLRNRYGLVYTRLLIDFAFARGTLHVGDDLDRHGIDQLRRRLDDAITAGCARLGVDCQRVRLIARAALVALADAKAHFEGCGGALRVTKQSAVFVRAAQRGGFPGLVGDGLALLPSSRPDPRRSSR